MDLVYYGNQDQLEYDFVISPGTDPSTIALAFDGAESLEIDNQGRLLIKTPGGVVVKKTPLAYQELDGQRRTVACEYFINDRNEVGFKTAAYDRSRKLTIDPVLVYSTYLGGNGNNEEQGRGIAVDATGATYIIGYTKSTDFPLAGQIQGSQGGRPIRRFCHQTGPGRGFNRLFHLSWGVAGKTAAWTLPWMRPERRTLPGTPIRTTFLL